MQWGWLRTANKACFAPLSFTANRLFQLQSLQNENTSLRRQVTTNIYHTPSGADYPDPSSPSALKRRQSARASRPMSMYETGSGLKPYLPKGESHYTEEGVPTLQPFSPHVSTTCSLLAFASPLLCFDSISSPFSSLSCSGFLAVFTINITILCIWFHFGQFINIICMYLSLLF